MFARSLILKQIQEIVHELQAHPIRPDHRGTAAVGRLVICRGNQSGRRRGNQGDQRQQSARKGAKAKAAKAAGKIKLVDINSASKAELKPVPGVSDQYADKIIAGRPYLSKADLATRKVIPAGPYQRIRSRVIAKPNEATAAKLSEMQKKGH